MHFEDGQQLLDHAQAWVVASGSGDPANVSTLADLDGARLFDEVAQGLCPEGWMVVGYPGDPLDEPLRPGDLVIRRALGEGRLAHVGVIADEGLHTADDLSESQLHSSDLGEGHYAHLIEGGIVPRDHSARHARLVLQPEGAVRVDTAILRPQRRGIEAIGWVEAAEELDKPKWVREQVQRYLDTKPYLKTPKHDELTRFFASSTSRTAAFDGWLQTLEQRLRSGGQPPTDIVGIAISSFFQRDQVETIKTLVRQGGSTVAKPLCGHQGVVFGDFATFRARQAAWQQRLTALQSSSPEVFWGWVQGALPGKADDELKAISRWRFGKTEPCQTTALPTDPKEAAIESRAQLRLLEICLGSSSRYPLWHKKLSKKVSIESGFRSRSKQAGLYEAKGKSKAVTSKIKTQRVRMFSSSAPTLSRHHWGTDFDLYEVDTAGTASLSSSYNSPFKSGKSYWEEWAFLVDFGHLFGFVQPYVGSNNPGEKDDDNSPPGSIVGLRGRAVAMWKRVVSGQLVSPPSDDLRGYLEERWHWSYAPVAQAMLRTLSSDSNMLEFQRRSVAYWTSERDIAKYRYPEQYGLDYVFNVAEIDSSKWV